MQTGEKDKKLVLIGDGEFAEIAYEYFTYDSHYKVEAFAVERKYRKNEEKFGLPVIDFEEIENTYPPEQYEVFVAITYVQLNRVRKRLFLSCKEKGYTCASYVSSHAFVWKNVAMGENVFIFEDNTVQYHVEIGDNVILWSGNHIGHRTVIEDHVWLTSHVVVSGFCRVGTGSFLGVNASVGDNVLLEKDTVLGAGAVTVKNLSQGGCVYVGAPARPLEKTAYEQFEVKEDER